MYLSSIACHQWNSSEKPQNVFISNGFSMLFHPGFSCVTLNIKDSRSPNPFIWKNTMFCFIQNNANFNNLLWESNHFVLVETPMRIVQHGIIAYSVKYVCSDNQPLRNEHMRVWCCANEAKLWNLCWKQAEYLKTWRPLLTLKIRCTEDNVTDGHQAVLKQHLHRSGYNYLTKILWESNKKRAETWLTLTNGVKMLKDAFNLLLSSVFQWEPLWNNYVAR